MPVASGTHLQRSQFARLFQRNGSWCLFHTLTREMLFGGALLAELYQAFARSVPRAHGVQRVSKEHTRQTVQSVVRQLTQKGLLVHSAEEDVGVYRRLLAQGLNRYRIQHLYLLPTGECNFRCRYCFVEDDHRTIKPSGMDQATARDALTVFSRLSKESGAAAVTFYGGEPLLNRRTTFYALRLIRRMEANGEFPKGVEISLLTNGSRVDAQAVRVFRETRPSVCVSIDGPKDLHDAARKDVGGRGTFDAVLAGYRRLQDAELNPSVSCTLNGFTIAHMDEILDFIIQELKPKGMGFNLLLPRIGKETACSRMDHAFAARELVRAFQRLRAVGIWEDRVMRRVRPYIQGKMHFKDCMGVGGQLVVAPDGRIGPCQVFLGVNDQKYFPLNVRQLAAQGNALTADHIYAHPLFDEWRHRFPLNMEKCMACEAISICGGGCPYASHVTSGSIWEIDERVCHQAKTIFEWMIWDTFDHQSAAHRVVT